MSGCLGYSSGGPDGFVPSYLMPLYPLTPCVDGMSGGVSKL